MEPVLDEYVEEAETEPDNESERGRRLLCNGTLTDVDTDQEPHTDGVDTEDGRTGTGTEGERTDVDEEHEGTPSQSRSSSVRPSPKEKEGGVNGSPVVIQNEEEDVDVFDGYSFKGRHSVLLEDEEEGEGSEGSYYEGVGEADGVVKEEISEKEVDEKVQEKENMDVVEEQVEEGPKTPEAKLVDLPAESSPEIQLVEKQMGEMGQEEEEVEAGRVEEEVVSTEGAVDGHVGEDTIQIGRDGGIVPPPLPPKPTLPIPGLSAIATTATTPTTPTTTTTTAPTTARTTASHRPRARKERSGIPALDRYLSDTIEERASDASASENEGSEDEDDGWDLVEAGDGEDRNGLGMRVGRGVSVGMRVRMKGGSLFARGVVDRYRLKVFGGKSSGGSGNSNEASGSGNGNGAAGSMGQSRGKRVVSGISGKSFGSSTLGGGGIPSHKKEQKDKEKQKEERRGRTPLTFKKHPREFLRAKSPRGSTTTIATIATSKASVMAGGSSSHSGSHTVPVSATSSLAGILLTPSHSMSSYRFDKEKEWEKEREKISYNTNPNTSATNSPGSPSLKSKESALSVGGLSRASSDQSTNGRYVHVEVPDASASELMLGLGMSMTPAVNVGGKKTPQQQQRKLKLKKYKNNAEKVLSLFSSPKGGSGMTLSNSTSTSNFGQQGTSGGGSVPASLSGQIQGKEKLRRVSSDKDSKVT